MHCHPRSWLVDENNTWLVDSQKGIFDRVRWGSFRRSFSERTAKQLQGEEVVDLALAIIGQANVEALENVEELCVVEGGFVTRLRTL